ncbi:MAG: PAS domain-containing protein [Rhodobacterales bacterium]|nr:PAS domain-containing protein [Rhodobacterales bacterium]
MTTPSHVEPIFEEMKDYLGFTSRDSEVLARLGGLIESDVPGIVDHFYDRILGSPDARRVLTHESQVESLKITLSAWLRELLNGPHDGLYYERRRRIGIRHVEVGLHSRYMFMAMSVFSQDVTNAARVYLSGDELAETLTAFRRISDLDIAIMSGTYVKEREQRQMMSLQELIVAHIPVSVLLIDREGVVTAATGPAGLMATVDDPVGSPWKSILPASLVEAARLDSLISDCMVDRKSVELPRVDTLIDGKTHSFQISLVPLEHQLARMLIHIEDLSDTVEAEARMQQSAALAHMGALSASVAHELRNPLAGMSAAIQVLIPTFGENDRRREILGKVHDQVRRLDGLVTDLLGFARPGHARMSTVNIGDIAEGVLELVLPEAGAISFARSGEGVAQGDPNLVHQILLNLIQNAIHQLPDGGQIRVDIDGPLICVHDSGVGVLDSVRGELFKPFFTTRTRGTGLGLAICARNAKAMGAVLSLGTRSDLGGAQFCLLLPTETSI